MANEKKRSRKSLRKIREHHDLLAVLSKMSKEDFKVLAKYLTDDSYDAIFDCVFNSVHNHRLSIEDRTKLKNALSEDRDKIRLIVNHKNKLASRKRAVSQIGAGFPFIASLVLPFIINLLTKKFAKKTRK